MVICAGDLGQLYCNINELYKHQLPGMIKWERQLYCTVIELYKLLCHVLMAIPDSYTVPLMSYINHIRAGQFAKSRQSYCNINELYKLSFKARGIKNRQSYCTVNGLYKPRLLGRILTRDSYTVPLMSYINITEIK